MDLISTYRSYFAKKIALKISAAATLSICLALLLGFNQADDFIWFAPFSVVIGLLMFPYQSSRYQIIIQRLLGISLAAILALIGVIIFKNSQVGLISYTVILTLCLTYFVGKNYKYNYLFFLCFLFLNILVCFALVERQHFYTAVLHFPFMVFIGMTSLIVSEIFVPSNAVKRKAPEMIQKSFNVVREHLADLSRINNNIAWFYYLERLLLSAKSQIKPPIYNMYFNNCKTVKVISLKLNYIAQHLKQCEQITIDFLPELKNITRLMDIALKTLSEKNEPNYNHITTAIDTLQQQFEKSEYANNTNFIFVLHEFKYLIEEMQNLNSSTSHVSTKVQKTSSGFSLTALRFSIQVTLTVALTIAAILYLKIPGGYQTLIAGIVIAATPHTGALILKFFMRMAGILFGGLCALLLGLILMKLDSMIITIITMGIFVYLSAWWSIKYEKFTYAGIQAGLMFIMLLLANGGHFLAIQLGAQRFEGVILGALIALTINLILAPELPSRHVKAVIKQAMDNVTTFLDRITNNDITDEQTQQQLLDNIESQIEDVESTALLQYLNPKKRKKTLIAVEQLRTMQKQLRRLDHILHAQEKIQLPPQLIEQVTLQVNKKNVEFDLEKLLSLSKNVTLSKIIISLSIVFENRAQLNKVIGKAKGK